LQSYRDIEKNYLDFTASLETSFNEGKAERGVEIAKNFISLGLDNDTIAKGTGLTLGQIEDLRKGMR
jgi:hypothetical protein